MRGISSNTMEKHHQNDRTALGFWLYLMTDLLMFAVLFAVYAVLRDNTFGAISIKQIFDPPFVLVETFILLTSSFTSGLGVLFLRQGEKRKALIFLVTTLLLGLIFIGMEVYEFAKLASEGYTPQTSAFLSAFFTLIGFHGLHIAAGSLWLGIMINQILKHGTTISNIRKTTLLGTFWHFLDIVWIFIFTIVYLFGGIL